MAAAIDARHRTGQRRDDMAAGVSVKREKPSIPLRVCGKVVILQCRFAIQRRQCKTVNVDAFDSDDKT